MIHRVFPAGLCRAALRVQLQFPARRFACPGTGGDRAVALGYRALAITDECSMAGIVRAHVAAKACGLPLKLVHGSELDAVLTARSWCCSPATATATATSAS
jgi:hypothetical protein